MPGIGVLPRVFTNVIGVPDRQFERAAKAGCSGRFVARISSLSARSGFPGYLS